MKRKLEMDDIRVGMYITALRGKVEQRVFPTPSGPEVQYKEKDHYNGKVLEVTALDMPYIVVTCHESRGSRNDSIDLRHVEVMRITPEYIFNLLPNFQLKKDAFWEDITDTSLEDADVTIEEIFKDL
jgi:hypothetical protein